MIINPSYKIELIDVIETAPDECFKAPADITRARSEERRVGKEC